MVSWDGRYISNGQLMKPRWTIWGWIHEPVGSEREGVDTDGAHPVYRNRITGEVGRFIPITDEQACESADT